MSSSVNGSSVGNVATMRLHVRALLCFAVCVGADVMGTTCVVLYTVDKSIPFKIETNFNIS